MKSFLSTASLCAVVLLAVSLSGCGAAPTFVAGPFSPAAHGLQGTVFGGQQPVMGAQIQLFTVGTAGNGSAPVSLLASPVYTGDGGVFNISHDYPCDSPDELVYLTATGGDPVPGIANNKLFLMVAVGSCATLQSTSFVSMNEITTVASIYALAPFMSSGGAVGASATNTAGIANAFATVAELVDNGTGSTPGPGLPAKSVMESQKLIALADAIAPCINSDGGALCALLFTAAAANGVSPNNIPDAVANIVRNPIANPGGVFNLITGNAPFATSVTTAPNDWSLTITYGDPSPANRCTIGYLCVPTAVAVDVNGNVWIDEYSGGVVEFSPLGVYQTTVTGGGMAESYGLAIDNNNQVWVTNEETQVNGSRGSLTTISPTGPSGPYITSGAGISGGGIYFPVGIAATADGTIWVGDYGDSMASQLTSAGVIASGSPFGGGGALDFPVAVAVDGNGQAWFADQSDGTITGISADGGTIQTVTCCNGASGVAVDRHQNVWIANYFGDSISEVSNTGTVLINGQTGTGVYHPQGIAIDGAGTVWVANYRGNSLSAFAGPDAATPGSLLTSNGIGSDAVTGNSGQYPAINEPFNLAMDASGSIWVTNYGSDTLVRFIGMAIPVRTPLHGPVQLP